MEKIIFLKSLSKQYLNLQNKVKQNYKIVDAMKLFVTLFILFFTIWVYWYFVNISSTKGYFLRQEMKHLEEAKFNHSIAQIEVLRLEKDIWENMQSDTVLKQKKIQINEKVVYIPYSSDKLAYVKK